MRFRLVQVGILAASCPFIGNTPIQAQGTTPEVKAEKSCPASSAPSDQKPSGAEISVAGVTFSGFLRMPVSDQDEIAASIKEETHEAESPDNATELALEIAKNGWQNHGYFRVEANGYATTLDNSPSSRRIALSIQVDEGLQYSLGGIAFKGNRAVTNFKALRALFPIKDGDVLSKEKIAKGLENLRKAYGDLGYINFVPVPNTRFDDKKKLIYLDIDMDEGKQFYVGSINIIGLDEAARQELLKDFSITSGQIFTSRLWVLSLRKQLSMLPDCGCADNQAPLVDETTGIVNLTFDFRPCSGRR
jgi:outer membrane protein assembly factor BamA